MSSPKVRLRAELAQAKAAYLKRGSKIRHFRNHYPGYPTQVIRPKEGKVASREDVKGWESGYVLHGVKLY